MNNIKQLPKLLVFAEVAKHGSFTQAARALGISKSAVSQQLSHLEVELGTRLLNRTTRGVSATALGEALLQRCALLQDQVDLIFDDITSAENNPSGRFAITFPHALEDSVVLPAVEQLCIEYPRLEPELVVSDASMDLVTNNLDLAIHAGELPNSSYRALPVGTMTEVFCATPLYLNRAPEPKTAEDLCKLRFIASSWQNTSMTVLNLRNNQRTPIQLQGSARANTLPGALAMALRHMGFVLLPDIVARPLIKSGELVHIVSGFSGPLWPVYTLHAYQADKPIHVTRFHQLVSRFFKGL
jgi:DNA-binding transcriptional LysR family regulator